MRNVETLGTSEQAVAQRVIVVEAASVVGDSHREVPVRAGEFHRGRVGTGMFEAVGERLRDHEVAGSFDLGWESQPAQMAVTPCP